MSVCLYVRSQLQRLNYLTYFDQTCILGQYIRARIIIFKHFENQPLIQVKKFVLTFYKDSTDKNLISCQNYDFVSSTISLTNYSPEIFQFTFIKTYKTPFLQTFTAIVQSTTYFSPIIHQIYSVKRKDFITTQRKPITKILCFTSQMLRIKLWHFCNDIL